MRDTTEGSFVDLRAEEDPPFQSACWPKPAVSTKSQRAARRLVSCWAVTALVGILLATRAAAPSSVSADAGALAVAANPTSFVSLTPARVLDTRQGAETIDGLGAGIGAFGMLRAGRVRNNREVVELSVAGRAGIPADAEAVALNLTVVDPQYPGFVTAWPCGSALPITSNVNYETGGIVANSTIVKIGTNGNVCLYSEGVTHLVVDATGYFPAGSFGPLTPARLLDTRPGFLPTVDGIASGIGRIAQGQTLELPVAGRAGIPTNADAVSMNLTVVSSPQGFITAWPCGSNRPGTSTLNVTVGRTFANHAVIKIGANAKICFYSERDAHLVVDVTGYFPPASIGALAPVRLMDTRAGFATIDGTASAVGRITAGQTYELPAAGRGGIPTDAAAVALNLTAVSPTDEGYITAWPCGVPRPGTSNLNVSAGVILANSTIIKIGTNGNVCLYSASNTDLVVDATAYFG